MTVDEAMEILETIDESSQQVSRWEAEFIETMLTEDPPRLTDRRRLVIEEMQEKYL